MSEQVVRVVLVDDHEVVRRGVRDLLSVEPDIEVIGEASTVSEALARVPALRPDVVVLDVRLPDGNGVQLCRDLKTSMPALNVLMLTSFSDDDALIDAIMAGASGYVFKHIGGHDLVDAIRRVGTGGSLLARRSPRRCSSDFARRRRRTRGCARSPTRNAGSST